MSAFGRNKKNTVHPSSDKKPVSLQNGGVKAKRSKQPERLWTDEIEALRPCDQFFIRQNNIQTEDSIAPGTYDIRNGTGKLVFKGLESTDPAVRDLFHDKGKPPFVITIFDLKAGKEMLRINANMHHGVMLVYVRQSTEDKVIGIVRRVYNRFSSEFTLERPNGAVLLKIQSSSSWSNSVRGSCCCCCTCRCVKNQGRSFHIIMTDDVTIVGKVHYLQKKFEAGAQDVEAARREAVITASFPGDTTSTNKALLLASLFMLDCIYFQKRRIPTKLPQISRTCYIIIIIVTLVTLIGTLAAVFGGRGYQGGGGKGGGRRPGGGIG